MTISNPVLMLENEWHQRGSAAQLGAALGIRIPVYETLSELRKVLDDLADDIAAGEPIVVLDAGVAGICRFETARLAVAEFPRARVILWTADRNPCTHAGALLDGAYAALHKARPLATLARVVERVATGRRWCEPGEAQWFADLLACMASQREGSPGHIWQPSELEGLPTNTAMQQEQLLELAKGEPMPANDSWFVQTLTEIHPRWLTPYLRRVQMALALYPTRKEAAAALGMKLTTVNGYASSLSGRLMPHRFISSETPTNNDHGLVRLLSLIHEGCEVARDDHDLSPGAFGMKPRG
jgi:DNA-binding NarL/FixJ family response regulator